MPAGGPTWGSPAARCPWSGLSGSLLQLFGSTRRKCQAPVRVGILSGGPGCPGRRVNSGKGALRTNSGPLESPKSSRSHEINCLFLTPPRVAGYVPGALRLLGHVNSFCLVAGHRPRRRGVCPDGGILFPPRRRPTTAGLEPSPGADGPFEFVGFAHSRIPYTSPTLSPSPSRRRVRQWFPEGHQPPQRPGTPLPHAWSRHSTTLTVDPSCAKRGVPGHGRVRRA